MLAINFVIRHIILGRGFFCGWHQLQTTWKSLAMFLLDHCIIAYMPTLADYLGVSFIQSETPGPPYGDQISRIKVNWTSFLNLSFKLCFFQKPKSSVSYANTLQFLASFSCALHVIVIIHQLSSLLLLYKWQSEWMTDGIPFSRRGMNVTCGGNG